MKSFHRVAGLVVLLVFLMSCIPANLQAAIGKTSYQSFTNNVSKELNQYIKKSGGTISLEYRDLITDEIFQINSENGYIAASTIKLPLAMYVMELADLQKIGLDQKLTYKSYHYIEGSGVVQYD